MKRVIIIAAVVLFLACSGLAVTALVTLAGRDDKAMPIFVEPSANSSGSGKAAAPATKASADNILDAGDYEVGKSTSLSAQTIAPGAHRIGSYGNCYWARVKEFSGELDDVIANGNVEDGKFARITVKPSDKGLSLLGECVVK